MVYSLFRFSIIHFEFEQLTSSVNALFHFIYRHFTALFSISSVLRTFANICQWSWTLIQFYRQTEPFVLSRDPTLSPTTLDALGTTDAIPQRLPKRDWWSLEESLAQVPRRKLRKLVFDQPEEKNDHSTELTLSDWLTRRTVTLNTSIYSVFRFPCDGIIIYNRPLIVDRINPRDRVIVGSEVGAYSYALISKITS